MVVEGGVDGADLLQRLHLPEAEHGPFRRRNGRCEFSTRLLVHLPTSCFSALPRSFIAALQERKPSVVMAFGRPCRFMSFFMNFSAAGLSLVLLAKDSRTSPS